MPLAAVVAGDDHAADAHDVEASPRRPASATIRPTCAIGAHRVAQRVVGLAAPLDRLVPEPERVVLAVDELAASSLKASSCSITTGSSGGSGTSCGGAASVLLPGLERLAVATDVLVGAAERDQQHVLAAGGWRCGGGRRARRGRLALPELARSPSSRASTCRRGRGRPPPGSRWRWMRPRWPGRRMIWLRPKLVTPAPAERREALLGVGFERRS